jgi:tRNA (guanine10-N2)-dimethyltransferase
LNWGLLRGARLNLAGLGDSQFNLIQSDARRMPIDGYNHIVTDPPYGRASSTRGAAAKDLVKCFLENMIETVRDRGTLCMCGSVDMSVPELLEDLGLSVDRHLVIKVHSGLTREIVTVKI